MCLDLLEPGGLGELLDVLLVKLDGEGVVLSALRGDAPLLERLCLRLDQRRGNRGELLQSAGLFLLGGTLYRFDTYLVAFQPGPGWTYFPTIPEMLITVGLVALEIFVYIFVIKRFPILTGEPSVVPA